MSASGYILISMQTGGREMFPVWQITSASKEKAISDSMVTESARNRFSDRTEKFGTRQRTYLCIFLA